jgi:hypothetical protein
MALFGLGAMFDCKSELSRRDDGSLDYSHTRAREPPRTATALMRHFGRASRALPYKVRGRGRFAIALTSLLLKSGADPIVHCDMAAGHRLRLHKSHP